MWQSLLAKLAEGDLKALARTISLAENKVDGYEEMLSTLPASGTLVIGITGPPGAGKSTLVDALIKEIVSTGKKVGVLCVDPSSPFNLGALLGDRIRMSEFYNHPNVFIRSLATRGSLGGLNPMIIEITEIMKAVGFDYIIVETVGVGQSEIEIAGLADITVVVMVPEAGDEVQTMKAGLMEIADIFVVNKADRPGANVFVKNLKLMLAPTFSRHATEIPIIKTIASERVGTEELLRKIQLSVKPDVTKGKRALLLTEKAYHLIIQRRMMDVSKEELKEKIEHALSRQPDFNLYSFVSGFK